MSNADCMIDAVADKVVAHLAVNVIWLGYLYWLSGVTASS